MPSLQERQIPTHCKIGDREVQIFELDPDGETRHFHGPRMLETVLELIARGQKNIVIEIRGSTASVIADMINPAKSDQLYKTQRVWQDLLVNLLPENIKRTSGSDTQCRFSVIHDHPIDGIRGEFQVIFN